MTDLHTHILPGMDDGAQTPAQSLEMLRREAQQGIKTVALTPHFYRGKERPSTFLERRAAAWQTLQDAIAELPEEERKKLPRLILGAEVAYAPGMWEWPELSQLCYEDTKVLLLEMPMGPWNDEMFRQIYNLITHTGIMPIIAHAERYARNKQFWQLFELQLPVQISAGAMLNWFARKQAWPLLEQGGILISDCHDLEHRPPNMGEAMDWIRRKKGRELAGFCAKNSGLVLKESV